MDDSLGLSMKQSGWDAARVIKDTSNLPIANSNGAKKTWRQRKPAQRFKSAASHSSNPAGAAPADTADQVSNGAPIIESSAQSSSNGGHGLGTFSPNGAVGEEEPEWTHHLEQLIVLFSEKCARRVMLHRESARYYEQRVRWLSIPSTVLGVVSGSAVFATWQQQFCGADWHQYINLAIGVAILISTALSAILGKSDYQALYAAHLQSYQGYDNLMRDLNVELCFEKEFRQPVRKVVNNMLKRYKELTNSAKLIPRRVDRALARTIQIGGADAANQSGSSEEKQIQEDPESAKKSFSPRGVFDDNAHETPNIDAAKTREEKTVILTDWLKNTIEEINSQGAEARSPNLYKSMSRSDDEKRDTDNMHFRRPSVLCKTMPTSSMIEMTFLPTSGFSPASSHAQDINASGSGPLPSYSHREPKEPKNVFAVPPIIDADFAPKDTIAKQAPPEKSKRKKKKNAAKKPSGGYVSADIDRNVPKKVTEADLLASHAKLVTQAMQQTPDNAAQSSHSSPTRIEANSSE